MILTRWGGQLEQWGPCLTTGMLDATRAIWELMGAPSHVGAQNKALFQGVIHMVSAYTRGRTADPKQTNDSEQLISL